MFHIGWQFLSGRQNCIYHLDSTKTSWPLGILINEILFPLVGGCETVCLSGRVAGERVQDTRPQNVEPWHTGIFHHEGIFRNGRCGKEFLTFPWSSSWDPRVRGAHPVPGGKEHPYLWRWRDADRTLKEQLFPSFSQFTTLGLYPLSDHIFSMALHSSSNLAKKNPQNLRFTHFVGPSFPYAGPHVLESLY